MSLLSFVNDCVDVRERFKREFTKPKLEAKRELVAPPLTSNYATVGVAFDYLLRFHVQYLNRRAIERDAWVAERAIEYLEFDEDLHEKGETIIRKARRELARYRKSGRVTTALLESALSIATLDPIARADVGHEKIGIIDQGDVSDLHNLIKAVDKRLFKAKKLCLVNPTFGRTSVLVDGADADLVIDDTIIEIKTTKKMQLTRRDFNQVIGYYILHHIGGVGEIRPKPKITKVAIYFSRFGYLFVAPIGDIVNQATFPRFVKWFKERAAEEFPDVMLF